MTMSSKDVLDEPKSSPAVPKSKKNKKKKSVKNKQVNGDDTRLNGVKDGVQNDEEGESLETEMQSPTDPSTPLPPGAPEKPNVAVLPNGKDENGSTYVDDDDTVESSLMQQAPSEQHMQTEDATKASGSSAGSPVDQPVEDTDKRLARLHEEREALRKELAEVRRSLEALQEGHEADVQEMQVQLTDANNKKEQAETQHRNLLGKVNTIRSQLGDRLKADAEELSQTRTRIEELEEQNTGLREENAAREAELATLADQGEQQSKELSGLRNRTTLSQQNFSKEREDLVQREAHAKEEFEAAKQAMQDWEILAMEERSIRESIAEKVADLEDQIAVTREAHEKAASERDAQSNTVDGLQRALQELQEARRQELREVVENSQAQMERLAKELRESEKKAAEAITELDALKRDLERVLPFEKEVKEKNLLIGKLRHEGVILNEHLTKALRYTKNLKKGRPEDTIGKDLVTNHVMRFLALDRTDPKKFQVLQIMANILDWTDEQREQAGLARPGASNPSLGVPVSPWHRKASTPALSGDFAFDNGSRKESLAELWSDFLEQEAQDGVKSPKSPDSSAGLSNSANSRPR